jgi:hypothetical protein
VSVPSAAILSGRDRRLMMSTARLAGGREASHTGQELRVELEQKSVTCVWDGWGERMRGGATKVERGGGAHVVGAGRGLRRACAHGG